MPLNFIKNKLSNKNDKFNKFEMNNLISSLDFNEMNNDEILFDVNHQSFKSGIGQKNSKRPIKNLL